MKFFVCLVLLAATATATETREKRGIFGESLLASSLSHGSYAPTYSSYSSYAPSYTSGLYSGLSSYSAPTIIKSYAAPTIIKSAPIISTRTIIKSSPIISSPTIIKSSLHSPIIKSLYHSEPLFDESIISAPTIIKSSPILDDHSYIKAGPIIEDHSYLHEPSYAKIIKVAPKYSSGWW